MHNFFRFVMSRSCHRHEIELTNPFCFRHRGLLTVRLLSILSFLHCVLPTQSQPMEDSQFFKELLNQGAVWKPEEGLLTEVPYGPLEEHKLDVYFPQGDSSATKDASIWMHIHGGGWSRGAKDSEFYGGPGVCRTAAKAGYLATSIGYRRGSYPGFMEDVADAIRWTIANIPKLGGNNQKMLLSGHSAGGHIASLLSLRHDEFLKDVKKDYLRGLILLSGVYDLFSPLKSAPLDLKNKWFVAAYVMPAFGLDDSLRWDASPLLLLDANKETSVLGSVPLSLRNLWRQRQNSETSTRSYESQVEVNINLPPILLLNAAIDMGLQENGDLFAEALRAHNVDAKHEIVPGTDHASICWNESAANRMVEFAAGILD